MFIPAILLLLMQALSSECGSPTIDRNEKAFDIMRKMNCFSGQNTHLREENAQLKQELAKMQTVNGKVRLRWAVRKYDSKKFPIDTCKSKAISVVLARNGTLLEQGSNWMDFRIGSSAISVLCERTDADTAYVIGASTEQKPMFDLVELLQGEIFVKL